MLKVFAAGAAMVPVMHAPVRRFVGRAPVEQDGRTAWPALSEPTELPEMAEYVHALQAGDLLPADEATARAAGVPLPKSAPKSTPKAEG